MAEKWNYEYNQMIKKNEHLYRSLAVRFELSECAFWILYILRSNIAMLTQRDLCEYLYQPKQSVNTGIKKLIEKRYIELSSGDDKRIKYLELTETGKVFCEKNIDRVIEAEKAVLTGLSDKEKEYMLEILQKYEDLLEERLELI